MCLQTKHLEWGACAPYRLSATGSPHSSRRSYWTRSIPNWFCSWPSSSSNRPKLHNPLLWPLTLRVHSFSLVYESDCCGLAVLYLLSTLVLLRHWTHSMLGRLSGACFCSGGLWKTPSYNASLYCEGSARSRCSSFWLNCRTMSFSILQSS